MFKVNKKSTGTRCKICSKLTIKTLERHQFAISAFNSEHISHLVLALFKVYFEQGNAVGVITGWQLATLLKLALFFMYFLGFITRLMILKLRNKLYKCNALNFLDLNFHKFPPHMNPFPLNTPNFTINVMLHRFTHRNSII